MEYKATKWKDKDLFRFFLKSFWQQDIDAHFKVFYEWYVFPNGFIVQIIDHPEIMIDDDRAFNITIYFMGCEMEKKLECINVRRERVREYMFYAKNK